MKVSMSVDSDLKTVTLTKDKEFGSRFDGQIASDVLKLRDAGYELKISKRLAEKLRKFELSESGKSGKRK